MHFFFFFFLLKMVPILTLFKNKNVFETFQILFYIIVIGPRANIIASTGIPLNDTVQSRTSCYYLFICAYFL